MDVTHALYVFGGPFSGKTSLLRQLRLLAPPTSSWYLEEFDDLFWAPGPRRQREIETATGLSLENEADRRTIQTSWGSSPDAAGAAAADALYRDMMDRVHRAAITFNTRAQVGDRFVFFGFDPPNPGEAQLVWRRNCVVLSYPVPLQQQYDSWREECAASKTDPRPRIAASEHYEATRKTARSIARAAPFATRSAEELLNAFRVTS